MADKVALVQQHLSLSVEGHQPLIFPALRAALCLSTHLEDTLTHTHSYTYTVYIFYVCLSRPFPSFVFRSGGKKGLQ